MGANLEAGDSPGAVFHPLSGLKAASRWNAAALEWMTKGVQQWVAWMAAAMPVIPPAEDLPPARAGAREPRGARSRNGPVSRSRGTEGAKPAARSRSRS